MPIGDFFSGGHYFFNYTPSKSPLFLRIARRWFLMTKEQKSTILRLRAEGYKYVTIADTIGLSINTVKSYCRRQSATAQADGAPCCKQCKKPLVSKKGGKPRLFCSDECRNNWWKHHSSNINRKAYYTKTCAHCGKPYHIRYTEGRTVNSVAVPVPRSTA